MVKPDRPVRAADVVKFIESCCYIPEGQFVGQPLRLAPFQLDFIRAVARADVIRHGRLRTRSSNGELSDQDGGEAYHAGI